jgi:outer membrane protein
MLNTVHKIIAVHFLALWPILLYGQTSPIDGYVQRALAENPTLLAQRLVENERSLAIDLASANKQVTVDFRSDYLVSFGGRRINFPVGDLFNPTHATLNQLTGEDRFPTDLENVDEQLTPSNFHDTRLEARLPILQPLVGREIALREAQLMETQSATRVLENQLRLQIKDLYFAYLQSREGQRIIDSSRVALNELLRVNRVLVRNDKATPEIISRTEAEIAQLDGQRAAFEQNAAVAAAALNRLINRPPDAPLQDDFSTTELDTSLLAMSYGDLSNLAQQQRPELKQLMAGQESLLRLEALQDAERRPTLGAFAQAGAQGFLEGDFGDQPYFTLGVGLSWNLLDGGKRNLRKQQTKLQRQQLALRQSDTKRAIDLEIWRAWQRIQNERSQLRAARSGSRAAKATYQIIDQRYRNQRAILIELLDARQQWTTSRLQENLALFRLLQAYAALEAAAAS